jgi:hypothetical protein
LKIGFFIQGPQFIPIADYLLDSIRRVMPDVPIYQLTDGLCPAIDGVEVIRIPEEMPMGIRRVTHYTRLEGDWCFCGCDVLFRKDVRHVFEKPFQVALATRDGTYMQNAQYTQIMPYNFDILFSRSPEFWQIALETMKTMSPEAQDNGAEQLVTCAMAKSKAFDVAIIPSSYNFTPKRPTDDISHVHILHMKGKRKEWIPQFAAA